MKNEMSCVILSCNELNNIKRNIEMCKKIHIFKEIFVIDDYSNDGTIEYLDNINVKYVLHKYESSYKQREYALQFIRTDWILFLDADEFLSPELICKLNSIKLKDTHNYSFARKNIVFGKVLYHGGWYPDYQMRLICKKNGLKSNIVSYISEPLLHYSHKTIQEWWAKYIRSTESIAEMYVAKKKEYIRQYKLGVIYNMLFNERGYKDGIIGILTILYLYFFELTIIIKIWFSNVKDL